MKSDFVKIIILEIEIATVMGGVGEINFSIGFAFWTVCADSNAMPFLSFEKKRKKRKKKRKKKNYLFLCKKN